MAAKITREDKSYDLSFKHGTLSSYLRHKCACQVCRATWTAAQRQREQHRVLRREACMEILRPLITDREALAEAVDIPIGRLNRAMNGGQWQGSFAKLQAMAAHLGVELPEAEVKPWSRRPGGL